MAQITRQQITRAFERVLGVEPREADIQLVQMMGFDLDVGDLSEYIWDHWMGEPDEPSLDDVIREVKAAISSVK